MLVLTDVYALHGLAGHDARIRRWVLHDRQEYQVVGCEEVDMARVEIAGDQVTVQIEGMDRLWTFTSRLEIPLAHVTGVEADPEVVRGWKGWRGPGAHIPGVIVAGTFHHEGDRVFWDVHDPAKAVVIHLADERYARLVIGVDDPAATAAAIRRALGTGGA